MSGRMKAAIIYWSRTGNTEKVALAINEGLEAAGVEVLLKRTEAAADVDFYGYDLICIGFPSYQWSPPKPMDEFLKRKFAGYKKQGRVKVGAPKVPGKNVLIFCTYSGPWERPLSRDPAFCTRRTCASETRPSV